jgi:hypothetical protein
MHVIFGNVMHLTYVVFLKSNMCLKSIVHGWWYQAENEMLVLVIWLINLVGNNHAIECNGGCYYLIAYDTCKHVTCKA